MTPDRKGTRLVVLPEHDGLRLDQFLAAATALSRRAARRLIGDGGVARNGHPTRVQGRVLEWGDVVDVLGPSAELGVEDAPAVALPILHDDSWLIAVDKPSGMISQPGSKKSDELALDQLTLLQLARRQGTRPYLRMVHRLDRLTSGVALFARNSQAHAPLVRAWSEGAVERRYLAVVEGVPDIERELIDAPIGRDSGHEWRFRVSEGGRPARTELRVTESLDDGLALVECRLLTGRTHQVRVHLAHLGHPVLGDRLYGSRRAALVDRPLLHAASLALPHPKDGTHLHIQAPPPADMETVISKARK